MLIRILTAYANILKTKWNNMVKSRIKIEPKKTESGIITVETKIEKQIKHRAEEAGKDTYVVANELGETIRVYKKCEGCEDPKACAESYARKMGLKWQ